MSPGINNLRQSLSSDDRMEEDVLELPIKLSEDDR